MENINLRKVTKGRDIHYMTYMYFAMVKGHYQSALENGFENPIEENYLLLDAENYLKDKHKDKYMILKGRLPVGMIVCKTQKSDLDGQDSLFINGIYIFPEFRKQGFGKEALNKIVELYHLPVELDCYYTIEAHEFYKKLGYIPMCQRYRKEVEE